MSQNAARVCSLVISLLGAQATAQDAPAILGLPLAGVPSTLDPREIPDLRRPHPETEGAFERVEGVLAMPIYDSRPYATLRYPCGKGRFYIVLREGRNQQRYFGPIKGDPFQRLNLETAMRTRLRSADEFPNDALLRLRQLIARGDGKRRALGFSMVNELPVPKSRHLFSSLKTTLNEVLPEISDAAIRDLGEGALARVTELTSVAVKEWDARRVLLPNKEYLAGSSGDPPQEIRWGAGDEASDLQVGLGLSNSDSPSPLDLSALPWAFGETKILSIWVRQQGNQTTKFTSSERADEGLDVSLVDEAGEEHKQNRAFFTSPVIPRRYRLSPGQWVRLKTLPLRPTELKPHEEAPRVPGLHVEPGEYSMRVQLRIAGFESSDASGAITVPAKGEWTGALTVTSGKLQVGG